MRSISIFVLILIVGLFGDGYSLTTKCNLDVRTADIKQNACELQQKLYGCETFRKIYAQQLTQDEFNKTFVNCEIPNLEMAQDAALACAVPVAAGLAPFIKNMALRMALGSANIYFSVQMMNEALKKDEQCYEDASGKSVIIGFHNQMVTDIDEKLKSWGVQERTLTAMQFHLTSEQIKTLPCQELRAQLTAKVNQLLLALQSIEGSGKLSAQQKQELAKLYNHKSAESPEQMGIPKVCLSVVMQIQLQCELLALTSGSIASGRLFITKLRKINRTQAKELENLANAQTQLNEAKLDITPIRYKVAPPSDVTAPSLKPSSERNPEGEHKNTVKPSDKMRFQAYALEEHAASSLAKAGYKVKYQTHDAKAKRSADLFVEGRIFDIYSPVETTSIKNLIGHVVTKARKEQTERVVVDLSKSPHSAFQIRNSMLSQRIDFNGIREVLGVTSDGTVTRLFP